VSTVYKPARYSLEHSTSRPYTIVMKDGKADDRCPYHPNNCIGHLTSYRGMIFLPDWMTPSSKTEVNPLIVLRQHCITGRAPYSTYVSSVMSLLRGKTGYVRSTSRMTVEGSIRMVISPSNECTGSHVHVPSLIATNCMVPVLNGGVWSSIPLSECTYGILVRQPCMWTGGIQPVIIKVTRPIDEDNTRNDVNASLRIPLSMCGPYGADFDGDEMTLIGIKGYQSEQECSAFNWNHDSYSPYVESDYIDIVHHNSPVIGDHANTAAICTTICWSDRFDNLRVTKCHSNWMTSRSAMIAMDQKHESAKAMALKAIVSMRIASSKSSSQSNVGASTRRSRIGAERLCLNEIGYPMLNTRAGTSLPLDAVFLNVSKDKGWYGNPAIRAVSKLCSSVITAPPCCNNQLYSSGILVQHSHQQQQ
jgi:hypothetical protein